MCLVQLRAVEVLLGRDVRLAMLRGGEEALPKHSLNHIHQHVSDTVHGIPRRKRGICVISLGSAAGGTWTSHSGGQLAYRLWSL